MKLQKDRMSVIDFKFIGSLSRSGCCFTDVLLANLMVEIL